MCVYPQPGQQFPESVLFTATGSRMRNRVSLQGDHGRKLYKVVSQCDPASADKALALGTLRRSARRHTVSIANLPRSRINATTI